MPAFEESSSPLQGKSLVRKGPGKALWITIAVLYILDQASKWWIVLNFNPPSPVESSGRLVHQYDIVPVIDGFFNLIRVHNTGVAFGLGNGTAWSHYVFMAVPVCALVILGILFRKGFFSTPLLKLSGSLLIAGVLGNFTDRLIHGYVVDFVDIIVPFTNGYHWPAFNVADSCVCIAAIFLFLSGFRKEGTA